jgi:hypothetical protein
MAAQQRRFKVLAASALEPLPECQNFTSVTNDSIPRLGKGLARGQIISADPKTGAMHMPQAPNSFLTQNFCAKNVTAKSLAGRV